MAKIYETPIDARRDTLVQRIKAYKINAWNAFGGFMASIGFGALAHQLNQAQPYLPESLQSQSGRNAYKFLLGLSVVGAVLDGYVMWSSKSEQRKAERELDRLGPGEQVIKLGNGIEAKAYITKYIPGYIIRPNAPCNTVTVGQEAEAKRVFDGIFSDKAK
jgi:hypothetical protein